MWSLTFSSHQRRHSIANAQEPSVSSIEDCGIYEYHFFPADQMWEKVSSVPYIWITFSIADSEIVIRMIDGLGT